MINLKNLPYPEIIQRLFDRYYCQPVFIEGWISSHWQVFSKRIKVNIDGNGNLTSLEGYGFGDIRNTHFLNKVFKYLCNLSYFVRLPYKKDLLYLINISKGFLRKIDSYLSYDCFRQICALSVIRQHMDICWAQSQFNILIIGDGYGFLAGLLKRLYPISRITLVDIGKVLFFQAVNLQKAHPECVHYLFKGVEIEHKADFLYVASEDIEKLRGQRYQLMINIASMQEMNYTTINNYFNFMRLYASKDNLFYCCNRKKKKLTGGEVTEFFKYPWQENDRHFIDEICPFYKYHFSVKFPFFHKFDGLFIHRLTKLMTST